MKRLSRIAVAIWALAAASASAQSTITDGDTLRVGGTIYRLWGIDAPETKQTCPDGWAAGRLATTHLLGLVSGRQIICERKDTDRYGRTVAICRVSGADLGERMVRDGYAWAFVRYSRDYVEQEALAKRDGLGVHAHGCMPAWEWRAHLR